MTALELSIVAGSEKERSSIERFAGELGWVVDSFSSMSELVDLLGEKCKKHLLIYVVPKSATRSKTSAQPGGGARTRTATHPETEAHSKTRANSKHEAHQEKSPTWNTWDKEKEELSRYLEKNPKLQLILIVPENLKGADRLGIELRARHILFKPLSFGALEEVLSKIASAIGKRRLRKGGSSRRGAGDPFAEIIGTGEKMQEVIELARKVAASECTSIMIAGECGTGKGTLAKAIHMASSRREGPFVEVNCAAVPRNLLESEFFGYEKGAFTDAREEKPGLFEVADGGTIFLDEIAEIDYSLQAKLLKFLDTRMVRRVSGVRFMPVDVRVISATNRDLREEVAARRFREDLYYRLNVVEIYIPPLRERREDIEPIAREYLSRFSRRLSKGRIELSDDALQALIEYHWPGNIRELINVIERAVLLNRSGTIAASDLPLDGAPSMTIEVKRSGGSVKVELPREGVSLEEIERGVIIAALERAGGNIQEAARLLSLGRGALRYKIKKFGIDPQRYKSADELEVGELLGTVDPS